MSAEDVRLEIIDRMRGLFLPPRDMNEGMERQALAEYADALQGFSKDILARAWERVRDAHKTRGWPTIGQFVQAASDAQRDRRSAPPHEYANGREINGQFQPWGGGCQCDACVYKIPRPGFYKAPKGDYQRDAATRRELDEWMWRKMYGPGTPPVPDFTGEEITVTAERAKALIEATRKKFSYGPQYQKYYPPREGDYCAILPYVPTPPDVAEAREKALRSKLRGDGPNPFNP